MHRAFLLLLAGLAGSIGTAGGARAEGVRFPSMALIGTHVIGPDAMAIPAAPDFMPSLPGRTRKATPTEGMASVRARLQGPKLAGAAKSATDDDDDDDDDDPLPPSRPGALSTSFVKAPTPVPQLKNRSLGPHLKPDVTFDLNDRTSIGIISQLEGMRASTITSTLSRAQFLPSMVRPSSSPVRSRDLGIGASIEFKLGSDK